MSQFSPREAYTIRPDPTRLKDFHEYEEDFVVRPPYQRYTVWSTRKKQALLDSLMRRYYVPRIVLREVRLDDDQRKLEVVDGQQRISTVVELYNGELKLPKSLEDLREGLGGKTYEELPSDVRRFIDTLKFDVDLVQGIEDPSDPEHQRIAAEIFWRLQQGETLTFMEIAHARLSSLPRNFVVKYGDDIRFDFESYAAVDSNPDKHRFFEIVERKNDRMQHLALLTRLLLFEKHGGPTTIRDAQVSEFIDEGQEAGGIDNYSYEETPEARAVLANLNEFIRVFERDPLVQQGEGMKQFRVEYFIVSVYLLLRHIRSHYVFRGEQRQWFYDFVVDFYDRWRSREDPDAEMLLFSENRQQSQAEIEVRDRLLRQLFFEWLGEHGHALVTKDDQREFSEAQRIQIYRRDRGLCQECLAEGKDEKEAQVPWQKYDADHVVPHVEGGPTEVANARVLCQVHNRREGARLAGS